MIRFLHGDHLELLEQLAGDGVRVAFAYVDPPFCTGRDFFLEGATGDELAFSDRWPSFEAYLAALDACLVRTRALLLDEGSIVVHVDPRISHHVRLLLDRIFGADAFANEIVWRYRRWPTPVKAFQRMHDTLLRYRRNPRVEPRWTQLYEARAASTLKTWGTGRLRTRRENGRRVTEATEAFSPGAPMSDVWDIPIAAPSGRERTGYPTQKPMELLRRLIVSSTLPGDLVLDPTAGSGTTLIVAEREGRDSIGIDRSAVAARVIAERIARRPPTQLALAI